MKTFTFFILLLPILFRVLLIPFPHSGQQNHHGSKTAYGGDYEAQRHWMEITLHLPLYQWYKYDLSYWGLDYPPLIAYGSKLMGLLSSRLVSKESVALLDSRGYEDDVHKIFMRTTVIVWDLLVYFPFAYLLCRRLANVDTSPTTSSIRSARTNRNVKTLLLWLTVATQPALILIDNGHFQYNSVCLGCSLGAFHFMTLNCDKIGIYDVIASFLFCLALNWKQMTLYYSPAVFSFLLGKCFSGRTFNANHVAKNISILGSTVIGTFFLLWYPFYHFREDARESLTEVFGPILRRIFPFSRGLFEGKVANIWCVVAIKPFSIRERIPEEVQPLCALLLTLGMILPFCVCLFSIGRSSNDNSNSGTKVQSRSLKALLWGSTGTSLSFFLASFQVHEKSILLPLAPMSLLLMDQPLLIKWFSLVSAWSLWHLLSTDRLQVVYFLSLVIFTCVNYLAGPFLITGNDRSKGNVVRCKVKWLISYFNVFLTKLIVPGSLATMVLMHVLEFVVTPPRNLPDIFPVIWVIVGCFSFFATWLAALTNLVLLTFNGGILDMKED